MPSHLLSLGCPHFYQVKLQIYSLLFLVHSGCFETFLSPLICLVWTALGSKQEANGSEGGNLEVRCPYHDDYINIPKYFCRDPCWKEHVLVKSENGNIYIPHGRFGLYDNTHGRTFTVTMNSLRLKDSGLYYCGIDRWGPDILTEVQVTVSAATTPSTTTDVTTLQTHQTLRTEVSAIPSASALAGGYVFSDQEMLSGNHEKRGKDLATSRLCKSVEVITRRRSSRGNIILFCSSTCTDCHRLPVTHPCCLDVRQGLHSFVLEVLTDAATGS
ncbi:hypothetical protein JZ751_015476 [Albula glossodonta]|uniref:Immunoglobulin domain-containing protein n=1 Tax=Albula glossodonta TaxID=121402 RepID=A0A8T2ML00_9TELE|nr:hypothetical protein JZ751_015476 [Albula glossodonta]